MSLKKKEELQDLKEKTDDFIKEKELIRSGNVKNHSYPAHVILLAINFILTASTSFRSTSKILALFAGSFPKALEGIPFLPAWTTIRSWVLRVGLHKLTRSKEKADDWIVIYDFIVQAGRQKCLLVLGVRQNTLADHKAKNGNADLPYSALEPLAIVPMDSSSGEKVKAILDEITEKIGRIAQLLCDGGGDVTKAGRLYKEINAHTITSYDVCHKFAIFLGRELKNDDVWKKISKLITKTKNKTKQSASSCLSPPKQRDKSRLMNSDLIVDWLLEVHNYVCSAEEESEKTGQVKCELTEIHGDELKRKLAWVKDYTKEIEEYDELVWVIKIACNIVRKEGLHSKIADSVESKFKTNKIGSRTKKLSDKILEFLNEQSKELEDDQLLLGSSEIIESAIGQYKLFAERTTATQSITGQILALGCIVGENSLATIKEALGSVTENDLDKWMSKNIGTSDLSKRRKVMGARKITQDENNCKNKLKSLRLHEKFHRKKS
jgi:hypothetical protein